MALRVTQHHIEFGGDAEASDLRMTEQFVQVGVSGADYSEKVRMTEQFVQVGVSGADYSEAVRLTEQFVQVGVHNEGRAKTALLGTVDSVMAGDTIILGHPSGTLDLQYYPAPTSQPGRPDSVVGRTMMVGAPVNQPAIIPKDYTGQLGTYISTWGAGLIWGYPSNQESGAAQLTGRLGSSDSSLGETMVPAYPSLATAGGPSVFDEAAQSVLSLSDAAVSISQVSVEASNSFSLTQSATSSIKMGYATTTIVLGVTSRQNLRFGAATSALTITQTARQSIFELSAQSNLNISGTWTQDADPGLFEQFVEHTISLTQEARTLLKSASAVSTLALTQETESNSQLIPIVSTLTLTQEADWSGPLPVQNVTSDLGATLDHDVTVDVSAYGRRASNTLALSQSAESNIKNLHAAHEPIEFTVNYARLADTFEESVSHTIGPMTQSAVASGSLRYFASSALTLESTVDNNVKTRAPKNTLALTQTAVAERGYRAKSQLNMTVSATEGFVNLWAYSYITLDHIGRPNPLERFAETVMTTLDSEAKSSIRMLQAESDLELDQDINVQRPYYRAPFSEISGTEITFDPVTFEPIFTEFGLSHEAVHQLASAHRYARNILSFSTVATAVHILSTGTDVSAESTLTLTDEANLSQSETAYSQLELEVTAEATVGFEAKTTIEWPTVAVEYYDYENDTILTTEVISQYAEYTISKAYSATSIIPIKQSVAFQLIADTSRCYYTPFIGDSSDPDAPTPPSATLPTQSFDATITRFKLVVPSFGEIGAGSPDDSIILRAPEFGNREGIAHTRVSRETTRRTLLVFRDPNWPERYTMEVQWKGLKKDDALRLIQFISDNLGLEIGIQDHEGRCWKGTIVNPDEAVTEDHNNNFSAMIKFEDVQRDPV